MARDWFGEHPANADLEKWARSNGQAVADLDAVRLRGVTRELALSVKELRCFYGVSAAALKDEPLPELLAQVVPCLPPAWQFPDVACARIVLGDEEHRSEGYENPPWKLAREIRVGGEPAGLVEVGYLEERPVADEGPFLASERRMLDTLAARLGRIAERKRTEQALRRAEDLARAMMDSTPHAMIVLDRDATILAGNETAARGLGVDVAELAGTSLWDRCAPRLRAARRAAFDEVLRTGRSIRHEDTSNDGSRIIDSTVSPLIDGGEVVGAVVLGYDVTDRKAAEQERRAATQRLESIVRVAPVGIGTVRDRVFVDVNGCMAEMLGYAPDELVGRSTRIVYASDEDFLRAGRERSRQIAETGLDRAELRLRRKDGTIIDVVLASMPIDPAEPSGERAFTALDITERKRAEQERLAWAAQRQQGQKLESLGVLASGVAHEFNNLLTGVLVNVDLALGDLPGQSPIRPLLADARKEGWRAAELTKQMLTYAGVSALRLRDTELNDVVDEVAELVRGVISDKAQLSFDLAAPSPVVRADPAQLGQALVNLVTNAAEALGDAEGAITVATYTADCDRATVEAAHPVGALTPGPHGVIEVTDTGGGIDEPIRARVFDPFFTTKFVGRGLGLAVVQGVVSGHQGGLVVESVPGEGTTVKVLLPALLPAAAAETISPAEKARFEGSGTVLVVDDEPVVRTAARRILERLGFSVRLAASGVEAVELFEAHHQDIDCVLLDLKMPGMDGLATLRALRRLRSDVPVVLSTGFGDRESIRQFDGEGLAGLLQKPYDREALAATLRTVLADERPPSTS